MNIPDVRTVFHRAVELIVAHWKAVGLTGAIGVTARMLKFWYDLQKVRRENRELQLRIDVLERAERKREITDRMDIREKALRTELKAHAGLLISEEQWLNEFPDDDPQLVREAMRERAGRLSGLSLPDRLKPRY